MTFPRETWEAEPELVELAYFDSEQEFLVVRALLEAEGIECFCPDWHRSHGGHLLQVRQEDLANARAILDAPSEPSAEGEQE